MHYQSLSKEIFTAFNKKYLDPVTYQVGTGSQTEQSLALYFGLVPAKIRAGVYGGLLKALKNKQWHLSTGVLGTKYVLNVMPQFGGQDLLYKIITNLEYPGYGHWIALGANTMWQTWDGKMSRNHIMFGTLGEWFYKYVAGIQLDAMEPGFKHFLLKPNLPAGLEQFECSVVIPNGEILVKGDRSEDLVTLQVTIPSNSRGTLQLSCKNPPYIVLLDSNQIIPPGETGQSVFEAGLDPGHYEITYTSQQTKSKDTKP